MSELNSTNLCTKWLRERWRPVRHGKGRCVSQRMESGVSKRYSCARPRSFVTDSQKRGATQVSPDGRVDKEDVIQPDSGGLATVLTARGP